MVAVVVLLGGGAGAAAYFRSQSGGEVDRTGVTLTEAVIGDLTRTVSAPGTVEPRTNVEISALVSAQIVELPFSEGDRVRRGDVIVRLDARDLEARLEARRAQLAANEAQLKGAEADEIEASLDFERLESLFQSADISRQERDRARARMLRSRSQVEVIRAQIQQARADIVAAERDLENAVIASPIEGVVTNLAAEVGELAIVGTLNNPGSVIMEVADLSDIIVRAQIDETNVADVEPGQDVSIFLHAFPDETCGGEVEFVRLKREQAADGSAFVEAEIRVDPVEGQTLFSGLAANVDIDVERTVGVVLVPSQSIVDRRVDELPREVVSGNELVDALKTFASVVYVFEDGKSVARPVRIGASDLTRTVVVAGIEPGERVVSGPYRELVDLTDGTDLQDLDAPDEPEASDEAGEGDAGGSNGDPVNERDPDDDASDEEASDASGGEPGA